MITSLSLPLLQSQTQYISTVPSELHNVFDVMGEECGQDSDCDDKYDATNVNSDAFWKCENSTAAVGICVFVGCGDIADCDIDNGEICMKIHACDDQNEFYDSDELLYSEMCVSTDICAEIETEGVWDDDTMV